MISKLSEKLTKALLKRNIVSADDEELYAYGFFMILSYMIYFCLALLVGIIIKIPVESMVFYIAFCILRNYAGGIHANTEAKCTVITTILITSSIFLIKLLTVHNLIIISSVMMFFANICFFAFAPLSNEQKKVGENERSRFRKTTILLTIIASGIICLSFFLKVLCNIGVSISAAMFLSAYLLVLGRLFRKRVE